MRAAMLAIWIAISGAACGGGDGTPEPDAFFSACGHPGDMGNSLGIGQFCMTSTDCQGTAAPLCSTLGGDDPPTFFCTTTCNPTDAGPTDPDAGPVGPCGEVTSCVCGMGGCGCTPDSCLN